MKCTGWVEENAGCESGCCDGGDGLLEKKTSDVLVHGPIEQAEGITTHSLHK